ncbi:mechanosensitive ion channel domain-containing protein [Crocosphaera sp. UHCC 0190]|uniref:mechanosensitive ion channel family protein n=1 Tax=Crocosphaera sp. UHCC 0190 TaxID=3110246 RepID=UPI002B1FBF43|nr:mechanosensitive ion channel domain-containing protein [Crocosphaera sp. UHCC 0190]MEA5512145.1 mechanosensitive ion channel domain-containing protein [Crocosphaera sp. UHCC 0190]
MRNNLVLDASYFWEEWLRITIILQRPAVQVQLLAIAISIFITWIVSHWVWSQFSQLFPQLTEFCKKDKRIYWQQYGAAVLYYIFPPLFCLIIVSLLQIIFVQQGWFTGYFQDSIKLLWLYCFYRIFLISLYSSFNRSAVQYYHHHLFAPLFAILIIAKVINLFTDLENLLRVSFVQLFGDSITLESIFVIVGGLYFWVIGCSLLEKLLLYFFPLDIRKNKRTSQAISLILRYFLITLGVVIIFGYVGVSGTAIAAITGGLSVGIGFGLKEVISNFVSGIWLLFEGALKPDDIISIDNEMSQVKKLGVRATTVQVIRDNSEKIIPNQFFFTQNFTTFTGSNNLVYSSVIVGANYDCNPQKVINILLEVANNNSAILKIPNPVAFAISFGDSSIDFELKFWLNDPLISKRISSNLICEIWQAFKEHDIEIPYPQQDLHIINGIQINDSEFLDIPKL